MQCSNTRLLTAISDHLGGVNLNKFRTIAHPTSDQFEACSDIPPILSNFDANSGNIIAASDCKECGKGRGGGV